MTSQTLIVLGPFLPQQHLDVLLNPELLHQLPPPGNDEYLKRQLECQGGLQNVRLPQ